ncbi:MAG: hypothetical protein IPM74_19150 [Crocinitomicaceae bacterium]|nr:hypothetical protein [Crocinitomicaceae bacterium]MBK8927960.1 hypothetical protein [Crocinitomicaceae bacterium]
MDKRIGFIFFVFCALWNASLFAQDEISPEADTIVFWEYAAGLEPDTKGELAHTWGSETVHFLGTVKFVTPSGKEIDVRIITSYRRITQANGFNDQSVLAIVKTSHVPVKIYDLVSRQNLPFAIRDNGLVYKINGEEKVIPLPSKLGERLCIEGLNCFAEAVLGEI